MQRLDAKRRLYREWAKSGGSVLDTVAREKWLRDRSVRKGGAGGCWGECVG